MVYKYSKKFTYKYFGDIINEPNRKQFYHKMHVLINNESDTLFNLSINKYSKRIIKIKIQIKIIYKHDLDIHIYIQLIIIVVQLNNYGIMKYIKTIHCYLTQ